MNQIKNNNIGIIDNFFKKISFFLKGKIKDSFFYRVLSKITNPQKKILNTFEEKVKRKILFPSFRKISSAFDKSIIIEKLNFVFKHFLQINLKSIGLSYFILSVFSLIYNLINHFMMSNSLNITELIFICAIIIISGLLMSSADTLASSIEKSIVFDIIDKKLFSFKNNLEIYEKTSINYFYSVLTSVFLIIVSLFFGFNISISIIPIGLVISFILINPLFGLYSSLFALYFLGNDIFFLFISVFIFSVIIKILRGKISISCLNDSLEFIVFLISLISYLINKDKFYLFFSIGIIIVFLVKACINTFSKFRKFTNYFLCTTAFYLIIDIISKRNVVSYIPSLLIIVFLSFNVCIFSREINNDFSAFKYILLFASSAFLFTYGNIIIIVVFAVLLICRFASGHDLNFLPVITLFVSLALISLFNYPVMKCETNFSYINLSALSKKDILLGIPSIQYFSSSNIINGLYNDLPLYKVIFLYFGVMGSILLIIFLLKVISNSIIRTLKHSSESSFILFLVYCTGLLLSFFTALLFKVDYISIIQLFIIISLVVASNKIETYMEEG